MLCYLIVCGFHGERWFVLIDGVHVARIDVLLDHRTLAK